MEVIPAVYMLKCVILAKQSSCDQTCILSEKTTARECCGTAQPSQLLQRCQGPPRTHLLTLGSSAITIPHPVTFSGALCCSVFMSTNTREKWIALCILFCIFECFLSILLEKSMSLPESPGKRSTTSWCYILIGLSKNHPSLCPQGRPELSIIPASI